MPADKCAVCQWWGEEGCPEHREIEEPTALRQAVDLLVALENDHKVPENHRAKAHSILEILRG